MREWVAATLAGAVGGLAGQIVAERVTEQSAGTTGMVYETPDCTDHPLVSWRALWNYFRFRWLPSTTRLIYGALVSMLGGALASFILWATYTSSLTFDSTSLVPSQIAAALTVGLTGVGFVRGLMRETTRADKWEASAQQNMETVADLANRLERLERQRAQTIQGEYPVDTADLADDNQIGEDT